MILRPLIMSNKHPHIISNIKSFTIWLKLTIEGYYRNNLIRDISRLIILKMKPKPYENCSNWNILPKLNSDDIKGYFIIIKNILYLHNAPQPEG